MAVPRPDGTFPLTADPVAAGLPFVPCDHADEPGVPGAEEAVGIWAQAWAAACSAAVPTYGGIGYRPAWSSRWVVAPAALQA